MYCLYLKDPNIRVIVTDETVDGCYDKLDATEHDWDGIMLGIMIGDEIEPVEVE